MKFKRWFKLKTKLVHFEFTWTKNESAFCTRLRAIMYHAEREKERQRQREYQTKRMAWKKEEEEEQSKWW